MTALDAYDRRILAALQRDGRLTMTALAEQVALSATQCARRLQRLEAEGLVAGYGARLDRVKAGWSVMVLVSVALERHGEARAEAFHQAVRRLPEVIECLLLTGDSDYQLRVVAPDLEAYARFVTDTLMRLPGVASIRSGVVLTEIKGLSPLPV